MKARPLVALIDGPLAGAQQELHCALHPLAAGSPAARHAAVMAACIRAAAPEACFISHAIFPGRLSTTAASAAAALSAAAKGGAVIVHCSFGLTGRDPALTDAVAELMAAGKRIVASAPAQGRPVYPAAFPGVYSVQGDARCGLEEWSLLKLPGAHYGACPRDAASGLAGASVAAAHFTGLLMRELAAGRGPEMAGAAFRGRERRSGAGR
ncbi:hypothetical protein [Cribrihabitans neustonicus]|uniref:hypothetical protein n=1 Tax=Cribrihabitans neustonicus TaxID=1429085 RepID=UPI003B5A8787